ncbi:ATP-binding protein [Kribbella sp. NPDC000426]|uniref:ATP-binding protein n=1 Tax=Kribbella sp. NPDC000426 TaxID=3154255 RepID=UPI00331D74DA
MISPGELRAEVVDRAQVSANEVDQILRNNDLTLQSVSMPQRTLRVNRLRLTGAKAGPLDPGPFDETFDFPSGVTVLTGDNFRGKTSILEIIKLMLRGESADLQQDVRKWLSAVSLDVLVNDQPVGLRARFEGGRIVWGALMTGTTDQLAAAHSEMPAGLSVLAEVRDEESWSATVAARMMQLLGLEELRVYTAAKSSDTVGQVNPHGWPSYFGAIYPPSGSDKILLGATSAAGLATRLLEVFLDLPHAALYTRANAAMKRLEGARSAQARRATTAAAGLEARRAAAEQRLNEASKALAELQKVQTGGVELRAAAVAADEAARELNAAARAHDVASATLQQATQNRITDERRVHSLKETAVAGALFHGLDPAACPRCEAVIDADRRAGEVSNHQCSICRTTIQFDDSDDAAAELEAAEAALAASVQAASALKEKAEQTKTAMAAAKTKMEAAETRLAQAETSRHVDALMQAEIDVATARGALEALGPEVAAPADPPPEERVLKALVAVLEDDKLASWQSLVPELDDEIAELARRFGIGELERVSIKRNANMDVFKGGGAKGPFGGQSAGERMRLRFAVVLGLLRVGRQHGIASHPGLLLLDSLKAEEMQDADAAALLEVLVEVAGSEGGIQVIATTQDRKLTSTVSGAAATIGPRTPAGCLF